VKPDATLESMVIINRANTEEAEAVLKIIHEFSDVFKVEVQCEPALVAPFVLDVDTAQWERIGKKTGPRPTGIDKQRVIKDLLEQLLRLKCIVPSQAVPYSDLHLVPKPPGSDPAWRPTMDYRTLNSASKSMGWPCPGSKTSLRA
jgi:hypothetical protein